MKDTTNITIALLSITAALLLTAVLLVSSTDEAVAAASESRDDSYIMAVGGVTSSRDAIYVIDQAAEKLNVYVTETDPDSREIILAAGPLDLRQLVDEAQSLRRPAAGR